MTVRVRLAAIAAAFISGLFGVALPASAQQQRIDVRLESVSSTGAVPRHAVFCTAVRRQDQTPTLRCDIRFDQPAPVTRVRVTNRGTTTEWSATYLSNDLNTDDSSLLFLVDRGGTRQATVRNQANDLADILARAGTRQRIAISTIGRTLETPQGFTSDRAPLQTAARAIQGDTSSTELFRFMLEAIRTLETQPLENRVLVVVSDGRSSDTAFTAQQVIQAAITARVRIIALGYLERAQDAPQLQTLRQITAQTGGFLAEVPTATRSLPAAQRADFLTRIVQGGVVRAEAPSRSLPQAAEVQLQLTDNRQTTFAALFTETNAPLPTTTVVPPPPAQTQFVGQPQPTTQSPAMIVDPGRGVIDDVRDFIQQWWDFILADTTRIILAIVIILAILILIILIARAVSGPGSSRRRASAAQGFSPAVATAPPPVAPPPAPPATPAAPPPVPSAASAPRPAAPGPTPVPVGGQTPVRIGPSPTPAPVPTAVAAPANTPTAVAAPRKVMPAAPALAYLDMIDGDRRQIEIMKSETSIGRMDDNDVMIDAPNVSRQHVRIVIRDGEAEIVNLTAGRGPEEGGVNPVEVNGAQIEGSAPLADNDLVRLGNIGQTRFVFRKAKS